MVRLDGVPLVTGGAGVSEDDDKEKGGIGSRGIVVCGIAT